MKTNLLVVLVMTVISSSGYSFDTLMWRKQVCLVMPKPSNEDILAEIKELKKFGVQKKITEKQAILLVPSLLAFYTYYRAPQPRGPVPTLDIPANYSDLSRLITDYALVQDFAGVQETANKLVTSCQKQDDNLYCKDAKEIKGNVDAFVDTLKSQQKWVASNADLLERQREMNEELKLNRTDIRKIQKEVKKSRKEGQDTTEAKSSVGELKHQNKELNASLSDLIDACADRTWKTLAPNANAECPTYSVPLCLVDETIKMGKDAAGCAMPVCKMKSNDECPNYSKPLCGKGLEVTYVPDPEYIKNCRKPICSQKPKDEKASGVH